MVLNILLSILMNSFHQLLQIYRLSVRGCASTMIPAFQYRTSGEQNMLLKDKTVIISGAAGLRGIGYATARLFAENGARVAILDLDQAAAQAAADSLGKGHLGLACNVVSPQACQTAVHTVTAELGAVDVLINNAGITQPVKIMEIDPGSWDRIMDVNLRGVLNLSQAVIPACAGVSRVRLPACLPCRRSVAAGSLVARIILPPRQGYWAWPRRWHANLGRTISG
jgi:NAD(P)-dependent dehydrogenase (short-subunit alcohol dehydrogenase family)